MNALGVNSPLSSMSSSSESNSLPRCRIQCERNQIAVGGCKFESASDALKAYLSQFGPMSSENHQEFPSVPLPSTKAMRHSCSSAVNVLDQHKFNKGCRESGLMTLGNGIEASGTKEDVEQLLTSKASAQLQNEVTDTLTEVKLRRLLKQAALKSQSQTKTGLQQEVEAALSRSAQLLEKVTQEDISSSKPALDESSSISTQMLLANVSVTSDGSSFVEEKKKGHIYSYLKSRPVASSTSGYSQPVCAPVSYPGHHHSRQKRRSSIDSLSIPQYSLAPQSKMSLSSSLTSLSNQSDPTDVLQRMRSRSVSPSMTRRFVSTSTPDWVEQLDKSVSKSVPSWVGAINPSEVSDSLWGTNEQEKKVTIPNWVTEVDKSTFSIDSSIPENNLLVPMMSTPAKTGPYMNHHYSACHNRIEDTANTTVDSRPGLNFSDLATEANILSSVGDNDKHVTFTENKIEHDILTGQSTLNSELCTENGHTSFSVPAPSKVLDSEYNGEAFLHNNILPQTAKLKKSIENFVTSSENLKRKSVSSNSSEASSDPKCSSLDTMALIAGKAITRKDISGARPISKIGNAVSGELSPSGNNQDSSDGLDGDRSWEKITNAFKPPVPVGENVMSDLFADESVQNKVKSSLSGGKQPGSMEALKNMLFKLQAEESLCHVDDVKNEHMNQLQTGMAVLPALRDYDFQVEPGGHSLEKALVHLNRLKKLVKNTAVSSNSDMKGTENAELESRLLAESIKNS